MRAATGAHDDRLRPEDIEISVAHVEADSARNTVGARLVHQEVRHHDPVVDLGGRLPRGLGDDRLVTLAVDHDLPLAFPQVPAGCGVLEDRQAPLFEHVHRGIDVPGDVVDKVLSHETHEVAACVAHEVFGLVLAPLHAHVAVDRRQALRNGAAALDVGLFHQDDLEIPPPVPRFVGRPAPAEAAADDEDVRIDEAGSSAHGLTPLFY